MKRSKNYYNVEDRDYFDGDDSPKAKYFDSKFIKKRMQSALKTKNIENLLYLNEDAEYEENFEEKIFLEDDSDTPNYKKGL